MCMTISLRVYTHKILVSNYKIDAGSLCVCVVRIKSSAIWLSRSHTEYYYCMHSILLTCLTCLLYVWVYQKCCPIRLWWGGFNLVVHVIGFD